MTDKEKQLPSNPSNPSNPENPKNPENPDGIVHDGGKQTIDQQTIGDIQQTDRDKLLRVLTVSPGLEEINDELGGLIGDLNYNEYYELAKILMQLGREERKDEKTAKPRSKAKMPRLMAFIINNSSEKIRNMQDLLIQHGKFHTSETMQELVLLTRLYYLRGINILNPKGDERKANTIRVIDDRDIVVRIRQETIVKIRKSNGRIIASYNNDRNKITELLLEDGKVYIFGRGRSDHFTVKNCNKNIKDTLGCEECVPVPEGIPIKSLSRAGLGVEVHGDEVSFYNRASYNTFKVSKVSKDAKLTSRQSKIPAFGSPKMFYDHDVAEFAEECALAVRAQNQK